MANYTIVDRRNNPKGKNLSNRQRFIERSKKLIKEQVREKAGSRSITDTDGETVTIPVDDITEYSFNYDMNTGDWDGVLTGNKEYITGDEIERPKGGGGAGGSEADKDVENVDSFAFTLTKEEYLDILFEDLELHNLVKESKESEVQFERHRAGFATSGSPNNIDLVKSLKNALGRRIALGFPIDREIKAVKEQIENETDADIILDLEDQLFKLQARRSAVTFIDQVDVRYRRFDSIPLPTSQAVMFCIMDVSGSMGEREKEIAKRFFLLLYLFLQRKYKKVEIRFIRHHMRAIDSTEEEFFYSKESGGTLVSTGITKTLEIIKDEYPIDKWNIYGVQASDGDNFDYDNEILKRELSELLPLCQHYVYNEVIDPSTTERPTNVFTTMNSLLEDNPNLDIINISDVSLVTSVFREVFTKRT